MSCLPRTGREERVAVDVCPSVCTGFSHVQRVKKRAVLTKVLEP